VPSEMRRMFTEQVAPRLAYRFGRRPVAVRVVKTFGIGESAVAERVAPLLEAPGEGISAGIYARDDGVHLRFTTAGPDAGVRPGRRETQVHAVVAGVDACTDALTGSLEEGRNALGDR